MEHGNLSIYTSDVFSPFGRLAHWFEWPNSGMEVKCQWNGLEDKNSERREKNETKKGWSDRINCLLKCFHSFKYVIEHADVQFFF